MYVYIYIYMYVYLFHGTEASHMYSSMHWIFIFVII